MRVASGCATHSWTRSSARAVRVLLGVGHPVTRRHQIELPGPDELLGTETVQVHQLAGDQPGHRLEAHVRMRPDAELPRPVDRDGAGVVDETPRTDGSARSMRQVAAHRQRAHLGSRPGSTLDDRTVGRARTSGRVRVVGGDRSAHALPSTPLGCATEDRTYPEARHDESPPTPSRSSTSRRESLRRTRRGGDAELDYRLNGDRRPGPHRGARRLERPRRRRPTGPGRLAPGSSRSPDRRARGAPSPGAG